MSANTTPSHYVEDSFVTDANFLVQINQKMKVPDKISFNTDTNRDDNNLWTENIKMNVPERILVAGQHQHVGTRAPPREIVFDNSLLPLEHQSSDLPRVATPPRTLTLDKYPFPGVDSYEEETREDSVVFKQNAKIHINDTSVQLSNSLRESPPPIGNLNDGLTPAEEVLHLRRQLAKLNRRVMALELENLNRLQKEKFLLGFGMAYMLFKVVMWMNRI